MISSASSNALAPWPIPAAAKKAASSSRTVSAPLHHNDIE
jgi:hypothetical protein